MIAAVTPEPRGALVVGEFAKTYPKLTDATGKTGAPVRFAAVVGGPADVISEAFIAPWVQKLYDASTDTFMSNKDTYATLQSQLYGKYWKS